jgi:outer membrane lipoprotein-sorting protein
MSQRHSDSVRRGVLVGLVGLLSVTAGCLAPAGTEIDDSDAVAEQVESRYETLDGFQATMVRTVESGGDRETTRATVTFDKGDYLRIAYHDGPNAGQTTVINDPSPSRLFAEGDVESSRADAAAIYGALAADLVEQYDVVYDGTDTIDGQRVAVYTLTPSTNATGDQRRLTERRVSVDVDRMVPVRMRSNWTADGAEVTETIRFENVSLGVPNSTGAATKGGAAT